MIIKKKTLNRLTGVEEQVAEQPQEVLQQNDAAQNSSQENTPVNYDEDEMYINPETDEQNAKVQPEQPVQSQVVKEEEINIFDLDNIDFSQRQERRRGDRRRGFRRVDDRNLVSRAREEADAIRQAAMNEGYQAGIDAAQADIEAFKATLGEYMNAKQEVFEYIAPDILEISVDIAQKIIKKEIEQDPQTIFNTIVDVLKTLSKDEAKVTLQVSPTEVNEIKQAVPELIELAGIDTKVVVLANEEVSEGGCLVTTNNGIVDATIESRIRVVMQALREI